MFTTMYVLFLAFHLMILAGVCLFEAEIDPVSQVVVFDEEAWFLFDDEVNNRVKVGDKVVLLHPELSAEAYLDLLRQAEALEALETVRSLDAALAKQRLPRPVPTTKDGYWLDVKSGHIRDRNGLIHKPRKIRRIEVVAAKRAA